MEKVQLSAKIRDLKVNPNKIRKVGQLPAVLYGHKVKNVALSVDLREFEKVLRKAGESTIVNLMTEDGTSHPVLIHDLQRHYLTSSPSHVDFYEVSMTEKLKAKVALEFVGEAPVVKSLGAVLVKILNEVEVECLPSDLPHNIQVSLDSLKTISDTIHIKDLVLPAKVVVTAPGEELVLKVQPPRDVEAELSTPVIEDVSKVEGAAEVKPGAESAAGAKPAEKKEEKK